MTPHYCTDFPEPCPTGATQWNEIPLRTEEALVKLWAAGWSTVLTVGSGHKLYRAGETLDMGAGLVVWTGPTTAREDGTRAYEVKGRCSRNGPDHAPFRRMVEEVTA